MEMLDNKDYAGKWNDVSCTKANGYVCQRNPGGFPRSGLGVALFSLTNVAHLALKLMAKKSQAKVENINQNSD